MINKIEQLLGGDKSLLVYLNKVEQVDNREPEATGSEHEGGHSTVNITNIVKINLTTAGEDQSPPPAGGNLWQVLYLWLLSKLQQWCSL